MQRKELGKEIRKYSHEIKFYKLSLIRRLVRLKEKRIKDFINDIPKVACPECGSKSINVEHAEAYWDSSHCLSCNTCDATFEDTFGLDDALDELRTEPYFDIVLLTLEEVNWAKSEPQRCSVNREYLKFGIVWKEFCERKIKCMLGDEKEDINSYF